MFEIFYIINWRKEDLKLKNYILSSSFLAKEE